VVEGAEETRSAQGRAVARYGEEHGAMMRCLYMQHV
jgi:hypothetical protein